jgi:hypothetical protein
MAAWAVSDAAAAPKAKLANCGAAPNGPGGGQLSAAKGVAVNSTGNGAPLGSVYVVEANPNHRVSQYSADCTFVRAWGWDVVASGPGDDTVAPEDQFEICVPGNGDVCKAGISGGGAGQLANPQGVAVDQSNGVVYVTTNGNRRVDVFSGTGEFAGAFGYDVQPAPPDPNPAGPDFCTSATGCKAAAAAGSDAGRFNNLVASMPALDPDVPGRVFVPDIGNVRVAQYSTTVVGGVLTAVSFDKAFGWGVETGAAQLEVCTSLCQAGKAGNGAGQFSEGSPTAVGVDGNGFIYVTSGPLNTTGASCSAAAPCRIQKFTPALDAASDFGPASGSAQLVFTAGAVNAVAALNLAIDPANDHVFVLRKESETSYRVFEYDSTGAYVEAHPAGALAGNGTTQNTGLAVGADERVFLNYGGGSGTGELIVLGPVPPPEEVEITAVENLTGTSARFKGALTIPAPGGPGFEAKYHFEYSSDGVQWTSTPEQTTGSVAQRYEVEADVSGLSPNTDYQVRLVATTGDTVTSDSEPFKTLAAPPRVELTFTEAVTQTAARLGAHIDPEGTNTTYQFEWATEEHWEATGSYDRRAPAAAAPVGGGNQIVIVSEEIAGLEPASAYRFRVVAVSAEGEIIGPDQRFETLNSCQMTGIRCFELISPADKGPVAGAGELVSLGQELKFQAAPAGGAIAYEVGYGFPNSTAPDESVYQADRVGSEWLSRQLSPAPSVVPPTNFGSKASKALMLADDLSCGIFASSQPLTSDTPSKAINAGLGNLYRRGASGDWTLITSVDPAVMPNTLVAMEEFDVVGMSPDCTQVVFRTQYQYPDIPGAGTNRLYEWDNGSLKGIASVPGPGGEAVEVIPGAAFPGPVPVGDLAVTNYWNAVSDDSSRIYFTAVSKEGGDAGKRAIFLRENGGATVRDVSQSQAAALPGGSPNDADSVYQTASTDGSEVFFLGRYGLAPNDDGTAAETSIGATACTATGTGCDLYRYSVEDESLTDLSVPRVGTSNDKGASVVGVLGASDDGSRVYFAARGQLVAGAGSTEADNLAAGTFNIYLSEGGALEYVGRLGEEGVEPEIALIQTSQGGNTPWSSRATPDGAHLLFETRANVTGYESTGKAEAYLYDATSDSTVCISCRKDGKPSVADDFFFRPLTAGADASNRDNPPRTISEDGERVFFLSPNALASGATEGKEALYLWEEGQVSFIADSVPGSGFELQFAGASTSGDDIYFTTLDQLTWQDRDGQLDLYDARVGGGIAQPPAPPAPCNPLSEGACTHASAPIPPALPPASSTVTGPGNQSPSKNKKKSKKKKSNNKKKKGKKGGKSGKKGKGKKGGKKKGKRGSSSTGGTKK